MVKVITNLIRTCFNNLLLTMSKGHETRINIDKIITAANVAVATSAYRVKVQKIGNRNWKKKNV